MLHAESGSLDVFIDRKRNYLVDSGNADGLVKILRKLINDPIFEVTCGSVGAELVVRCPLPGKGSRDVQSCFK